MATITWLGEEGNDLKEMTWRGLAFEKDKAVQCDDPETIKKAQGNKYFKVEGAGELPPTPPAQPAPSQMATQFAAPKPGEPLKK